MKISILSQLTQIAMSCLLGGSFGFLYDTFKVFRREGSRKSYSAFMDALFCIIVCFALFVMGMSVGEGSLDLAMLAFTAVGFCAYIYLLSDRVFAFLQQMFGKIKRAFEKAFSPLEKILKKIAEMAKKLFSNIGDWFRIRNILKQINVLKRDRGGQPDGEEKNSGNCGACNYGDDSLWGI